MALSLSAYGAAGTGTSASVAAPTGANAIQPGDWLFFQLVGSNGPGTGFTSAPGYGVVTGRDTGWINAGGSAQQISGYKQANDFDASLVNFVFGWTNSQNFAVAIVVVKGLGSYEFNAAHATSSGTTIPASSVSALRNSSVLVNFYSILNATSTVQPGGQTSLLGQTATLISQRVAWEQLAATGATGTRTATNGGTSAQYTALSVTLHPQDTAGVCILPAYTAQALPPAKTSTVINATTLVGLDSAVIVGQTPNLAAHGATGFTGGMQRVGGPNISGVAGGAGGSFAGSYKVAGHTYEGTTGTPIGNRWVFITPRSAQSLILNAQYTDAGGAFQFNNLAPGLYDVYATNPDNSEDDVVHAIIAAVSQ